MNPVLYLALFVRFFHTVVAKNVFDFSKVTISPEEAKAISRVSSSKRDQIPFGNEFEKEKSKQAHQQEMGDFEVFQTGLVSFQDTSIFTYYLRDNYEFIHNTEAFKDIMLFMPTDSAIKSLSAKPWEFPGLVDPKMSEKAQDEVAKENILHFVKSHMVDLSHQEYRMPDQLKQVDFGTVNGNTVSLINKAGEFFVLVGSNRERIISTKVEKYGEQTITFVVVDGVLDWPGRK